MLKKVRSQILSKCRDLAVSVDEKALELKGKAFEDYTRGRCR